jgi:hypothetical protein
METYIIGIIAGIIGIIIIYIIYKFFNNWINNKINNTGVLPTTGLSNLYTVDDMLIKGGKKRLKRRIKK